MTWKPHVTVAAIAMQDDRFLMVEESINGKMVLNQPAGHLENNESLKDAVIRETLEETAWHFEPACITGIYQWKHPGSEQVFLRFCFKGTLGHFDTHSLIDPDINQTLWLTYDEIKAQSARLRSPMVLACIDDYLDGQCFPTDLISNLTP